METSDFAEKLQELEAKFRGQHVLLGLDRLHSLSGVQLKLSAFNEILSETRMSRSDLVMVQVLQSSRHV
jgi:trehalose-6-phosphate synthase